MESEQKTTTLAKDTMNKIKALRNTLAHGSSMLHPNSISTLTVVADVINQLFSGENNYSSTTPEI